MKTGPSSNDPSPLDELPLRYRIGVQAILAEPMPSVDLAKLMPAQADVHAGKACRRRWMIAVGAWSLAGAAAAGLVLAILAIWPTDAWSQLAARVRKQAWVRLRLSDPKSDAKAEIWLSPTKRIAAARFPAMAVFLELDQRKLQRYDRKTNTIYVTDPESHDQDYFDAFDSVLQSFGGREEFRQRKLASVKLVAQSRREARDARSRWTEYVLDYEDARRSPPRFRRLFRVSEGKELPERMTEEWTFEGKTTARTFEIDYPATGPTALLALDVPKDAKVIDCRSGEELRSLLAAYGKEQSKPFDPYEAVVLATVQNWRSIFDAFKVRLDAAGHRAEAVDGEELAKRVTAGAVRFPEGVDPVQWWKTEVNKMGFHEYGQADMFHPGQTFCPDLVGYPLLGIPNEGMRVTLDPKPAIGPSGSMMVTVEDAKTGSKLRRYWFAADRGYLCVRWEEFPEKVADWISTTIVDAAAKSPKGRWYATMVRRGRVEHSGEDLRAEAGVAPVATQLMRYLVEFK